MIQAIVKKGRVLPEEIPAPLVSPGCVLIKVVNSCISAGTELSMVTGSGKSLIRRALEQPANVKKALNMAKSEGIAKTYARIKGGLNSGDSTGYSIAGVVLARGEGVIDFQPGDRVAAAGAGSANHAEYVNVPRNLVMHMPNKLDFASASTVALGGIAMQAVRRAGAALGEFVAIMGAGILGQLSIQMLSVSGIRVIAVDLNDKRLCLAEKMGAEAVFNPKKEDAVKAVNHYTGGYGADIVIFCAATSDSHALSNAFGMTRRKGRLVMVGVWGNKLNREDVYKKELDFLISASYGPGRYDQKYEEKGLDYPYAYIRWTENRNMEEFLRLLASKKVNIAPLIQATYPIDHVEQAFKSLLKPDRPLMVLLDYGQDLPSDFNALTRQSHRVENRNNFLTKPTKQGLISVGIIGAGGFATGMHLPNLRKFANIYEIRAICNRTGSKAKAVALRLGAKYSTTDYREILTDPEIDLAMICTRHNLHGKIVLESLQAGKHTFVEKPLCTKQEELDAIKDFFELSRDIPESPTSICHPLLMVGFNRRFSKYAGEVKKHVSQRINPLFIRYRMNAGYIPLDHWMHTEEGGGRIIGEACHIIDLFSFLIESPVQALSVAVLRPKTNSISSSDNKSIVLAYKDGSVAILDYFAVGSKELAKEEFEVHFDEKSIIVNDFKSIQGFGIQVANMKSPISDKGQMDELKALADCLSGQENKWPISLECLIETTEISFRLK